MAVIVTVFPFATFVGGGQPGWEGTSAPLAV